MRTQPIHRSGTASLGLVLAVLVVVPSAAFAHTGVGATHGLLHGLSHPLSGWDHLLAMVAVGLWAAQRGGQALWALPAAFVGAMLFGGALALAGIHVPGVEAGTLASVLVLGALIAAAPRFPIPVSIATVALFALFHGHAHGTEMPHAVSVAFYGLGFASSTALLHAAGVVLVVSVRRSLGAPRQTWVRLAGASIGFAGVALLLL